MSGEYWLSDEAWSKIEPFLPKVYAGARRKDDRRIISGIIHVLYSGCRWQDCPAVYGPPTTGLQSLGTDGAAVVAGWRSSRVWCRPS